ncbi:hypothetical protein VU10_01565 [Desulfobulbus sp. US1]|nr:hypothetical protein [Desulfobulbus sp. US4]MCW5207982.1 hypothetical protein [Desulfobulbus sp. US2]MCW5208898.1 hypothetical protein [Desulfobulbus sp. US1]
MITKRMQRSTVIGTALICLVFFAACEATVRKEMPKNGSLSYGEVVYVENDGRCDNGQVIKVTGGKRSREIPRKYECVFRPD